MKSVSFKREREVIRSCQDNSYYCSCYLSPRRFQWPLRSYGYRGGGVGSIGTVSIIVVVLILTGQI